MKGATTKRRALPWLLATLVFIQACKTTATGTGPTTDQPDVTVPTPVTTLQEPTATTARTQDANTYRDVTAGQAREETPPAYLEEVIPPCTPIDGSDADPCVPGEPTRVRKAAAEGSSEGLPDPLPTMADLLLGKWSPQGTADPLLLPHVVIRGTPQPGTTRCEDYPLKVASYAAELHPYHDLIVHVHCFAQIRVSEYLVGTGPPELTVSLHREIVHLPTDGGYRDSFIALHGGEDQWVDNALDFPARRTGAVYEGKELVLFLGIPTLTVEAWETELLMAVWFVQQTGNNPPRVVERNIRLARTSEQRARMNLTLAELERQVKAAATNRVAVTGGRIGMASDLPMLVTDANKLRDFYGAVGAVYDGSENSTVLPPPVPGADQLPGPPANTGENETPNGTPPTPGEDDQPPGS